MMEDAIRILKYMAVVNLGENETQIMPGVSSEVLPGFDNFQPGDNPFRYDHYHMGKEMGSNITIMFPNHSKEKMVL